MQVRVMARVKKWDAFFTFDDDYKRKSFFYNELVEQEMNKGHHRNYENGYEYRIL